MNYEADDFDRAVAAVSAERSPRALVERVGVDWDYLARLALDAAATVLGEQREERGHVVSYGGEAFTAGFLIGMHLPDIPRGAERLAAAVDAVQVRGRHAVIADHCDLASVANLETVYAAALVESMPPDVGDQDVLLPQVTRIFEAGLAVGLETGSGGDGGEPPEQA